MRTVGGQRAVVDLAAGQIGHGRNVEQRGRCWEHGGRGAAIGRVGVGQAGVVAAQLAIGVGDRAEPLAGGALGRRNSAPS